jgi:hypothetical protein
MQSSDRCRTTAGNHDHETDIPRHPTPPDSGRSFYSATAQTVSGHQTDRTAFFTPESSPESIVSISNQPSPNHICPPALAFRDPSRSAAMSPAECEHFVPSFESASRTGRGEESEIIVCGQRSPCGASQGSKAIPGEILPELGRSCGAIDEINEMNASFIGDVDPHAAEFTADGLSEAYELIPGPDSPSSSTFCFQASSRILDTVKVRSSRPPKKDTCAEDEVFCQVHSLTKDVLNSQPISVTMSSYAPDSPQTLVPTEPAVSMAPPIFISSPTQHAFSSDDEARACIPRLALLLQQLQHLHGENHVDVLLTCFRLASAHHLAKNLIEAKCLFMRCLQMSTRYEQIGIDARVFEPFDSVLGPKHLETRRIIVLLHDLELELQRQICQPKVIASADALNLGQGKRGGHISSTIDAFASPNFSKKTSVKVSVKSPHGKRDAISKCNAQDNFSHVHQGQVLTSRDKVGMKSRTENAHNGDPASPAVLPRSETLLNQQERPTSPTFQPSSFRDLSRVHKLEKVSPTSTSPSAKPANSVSPTFAKFHADGTELSIQSAGNESSVSPTFNRTLSPHDFASILSNVKLQASTHETLPAELEATKIDVTSNFWPSDSEVFDVDCHYEHGPMPIEDDPSHKSKSSQIACILESRSLGSHVSALQGPTQWNASLNPSTEWSDQHLSRKHFIDKHVVVFESKAQTDLMFSSAQSLDELSARTARNLMQHQLVEGTPNLTQIFYPVTSSLAYVVCDLNAGPAALGRRFSDSINQLHAEHEIPISPKKVGQGKCLKVILLQPPQMQISSLFSYGSLCAHECFLYMNTESTVEIQSCRDLLLPTSLNHGFASIEISKLPGRLSMNDFVLLAGTICSWNLRSQDHVCCILMDIVFGARISALLLGMLSLAVGQFSDVRDAQNWLETKGDCGFTYFVPKIKRLQETLGSNQFMNVRFVTCCTPNNSTQGFITIGSWMIDLVSCIVAL